MKYRARYARRAEPVALDPYRADRPLKCRDCRSIFQRPAELAPERAATRCRACESLHRDGRVEYDAKAPHKRRAVEVIVDERLT